MKYMEVLKKKAAAGYKLDNVPVSRKQDLDKDDILPSNTLGDVATGILTNPITGIARNKARSIRKRTGEHSPYLHDYFGDKVSRLLFGGLAGTGAYAYSRLRGSGHDDAMPVGFTVGALSTQLPSIAAAAAALITRSRTIEEQAAADKEPLWKRYLIPGYGAYSDYKRIGSENAEETESRRILEAAARKPVKK